MLNGGYDYHANFYPNLVKLVKSFDIQKMRTELGMAENN